MECDAVRLQLSAHERPTLRESERGEYEKHLATCEACRALSVERRTDAMVAIMKVPTGALDSAELVLPLVDPMVFEIAGEIAAGGMGQVLLARDKRLGRDVAIKEILEPGMRPRFEREASITARLQHPSIIPIYEAGTWPDGKAFYAMRLVEGRTLARAIDAAKTLEAKIALLPHVVAITEALAYAHARRVIHRDLKSGNALVGAFGETVVIDWGLAKELDRPDVEDVATVPHHALTRVGAVMGTPCFMAPEQARGEELDERADVYALGAILYHLLSGTMPYWDTHGSAPETIIGITKSKPPTPLVDLAPETPTDLRAIVERAMAFAPHDRYRNAGEMAEELRRFEAGKLIARTYTLRELLGRWLRRHRTAVTISAIAAVVLAIIAAVSVVEISGARDTAETALVVADHERDAAIDARRRAVQQTAALLEERGRSEHDGPRALVYLSAALDLGRDTPALRYLIGAASRELDLAVQDLGKAGVLGLAADGIVITATGTKLVRAKQGAVIDTRELPLPADHARLDAEAKRLFLAGTSPGVALKGAEDVLIDVGTGEVRWRLKLTGGYRTPVFDRRGGLVALVEHEVSDGGVIVVDNAGTATKLALPGEPAQTAAFSDDGARLAVCGTTTVAVWEVATKRLLASSPSKQRCERLGFVADRIAFTRGDVMSLWTPGTDPVAIDRRTQWLSELAVDPATHRFALGAETGVVRIWNPDGVLFGEVTDAQGAVATLAFAGDALVGRSDEARTFVWDVVETPRLRRAIPVASGHKLAIDPTGTLLATTSFDHDAQLWKLPRGPRIARIASGGSAVLGAHWLSVAPTGQESGRVTVSELATGKPIRTLDAAGTAFEIERVLLAVTSIDQLAAALATGASGDFATARGGLLERQGDRLLVSHAGSQPFVVKASGAAALAGDTLVVASGSKLRSWNTRTRVEAPPIAIPTRSIHSLAVDERFAFVFESGLRDVRIVDLQARTVVELRTTIEVEAVGRGPGDTVVTAGNGTVQLWERGTLRFAVPGLSFASSPDGTLLAVGAGSGVVSIYDTRGVLLEQLQASTTSIRALAFAADGTRLVAQSEHTASLWDLPRETASAADVAKRPVPWRLVDGQLVRK